MPVHTILYAFLHKFFFAVSTVNSSARLPAPRVRMRILRVAKLIPGFNNFCRSCSTRPNAAGFEESPKAAAEENGNDPWKDPYKHAIGKNAPTFSDFREVDVNWDYVQRLLPKRVIPTVEKADGTITPSGWRAPKESSPDLPYYIRRGPNNMPEVYLERRRDELNPKTMDFEYMELVVLRNVYGDVFACEQDLRNYLESQLGQPVATHVDELKGVIKVKGADRTLIEQFVYDYEAEFTLIGNGQ